MHLLGKVRRPLRFREGDGVCDYFLGRGEGLSEVLGSLGRRCAEGVQESVSAGNVGEEGVPGVMEPSFVFKILLGGGYLVSMKN